MGGDKAIVSRSIYVDRLRRAFLLRCHPDRFRRHDETIRKQQSVLLQALGERMIQSDFKDYTSNIGRSDAHRRSRHGQHSIINYALEKRDGSLLHRTLDLSESVSNILQNLASALESSGAAKLPPPPPPPTSSQSPNGNANEKGGFYWVKYTPHDGRKRRDTDASRIDHRYDVNSNRGRDLQWFLSSVTPSQIEERRAHRMDATAAALVARRLFSFQSIDGVHLGWSSKSFAGLLSSLIRFHEEHHHRFNVDSFYPLGLVFTNVEKKPSLDVFGGNIYLSPAGTQLEWLECIKEVTDERLQEFSRNRRIMTERVALLQEGLMGDRGDISSGSGSGSGKRMRVKKGFTCTSLEYYLFLERVTAPYTNAGFISAENPRSESKELMPVLSSSYLCSSRHLRLVVESPNSSRRPKVTPEGFIQVPSTITNAELVSVVSKLSVLAEERWDAEQQKKDQCRDAADEAQWKLGLQKISRTNERVRREDFLSSLSRLIDHEAQLGEGRLSGSNLQISTSGQFCHLSDDGSLVIPHNWTLSAM